MIARAVPALIVILAALPAAARADMPAQAAAAYIAAQKAFDVAALAAVTAPDFVEISPVGEVDPREKVLGFYAPENRREAPAIAVTEQTVRSSGSIAIVTARLSIGAGAMRAVYVARKAGKRWLLVSAQYTPIRERKPG